jgi:hypothetical protein
VRLSEALHKALAEGAALTLQREMLCADLKVLEADLARRDETSARASHERDEREHAREDEWASEHLKEKDRETEREMSIFVLEEVTDEIETEILHLKVLMDYWQQERNRDRQQQQDKQVKLLAMKREEGAAAAAKGKQLHVLRLLSKSRAATVSRAWRRWSELAGESETSQRLSVAMFHRLARRRALCLGRICGVAFSLLCTATARAAALRATLQHFLRTRMSQQQKHVLSRWHAATCAVRKLRRALCKMQGSGTLIIGAQVSALPAEPAVEHARHALGAPTSACFRAMSLRGFADGCAGVRRAADCREGARSDAKQRARGGRARYSPRA